ncbi:MAG TPA: alpha/beta hydrolase [Solirubrobacteraceae bacterium]
MPDAIRSIPETLYARNGDVHIAYQAFGEGEVTFVGLPGIISNVELIWEDPEARRWLRRLGSFVRVVHYDKRGQGLSDRDTGVPTLDERLGDLAAVLGAVGVERVALGGVSEGGSTAAMFAATYPERVSALVMHSTFAWYDPALGDAAVPQLAAHWGTPETLSIPLMSPHKVADADYVRYMNRVERMTTTPAGLLAAWRWIREVDLRPVLDSIQCPTLITHRTGDRLVPVEYGRYLAERISGARLSRAKATPTRRGRATRSWRCRPSKSSSPAVGKARVSPNGCWQPCCSPTSSTRPHARPRSGTEPGVSCSTAMTASARAPCSTAAGAW